MKISFLALSSFILSLLLVQCVVTKPLDFSEVSVAEEGGLKFSKISNESDFVIGPNVLTSSYMSVRGKVKTIRWYAAPFIGLSADGKSIGFISNKGNVHNIHIKSTVGGSALVQRTYKGGCFDLAFSHDGKNICFSDNSEGNQNVYTINAKEGSAIRQITSGSNGELGAIFSYDDKTIFFTKEEKSYVQNPQAPNSPQTTSRYYIWGYSVETSMLTQYTEGFTPCPFPDGNNLLITRSNRETGNGEIWLIDIVKGIETQILAMPDKSFSSPDLSPDGKTIVVVGVTSESKTRSMNLDLYTIKLDGTGLTQLTFHPSHDTSPKWSNDGSELFFISARGSSNYGIWKMDYKKQQ
jgi:Tol biopolymer transport system component